MGAPEEHRRHHWHRPGVLLRRRCDLRRRRLAWVRPTPRSSASGCSSCSRPTARSTPSSSPTTGRATAATSATSARPRGSSTTSRSPRRRASTSPAPSRTRQLLIDTVDALGRCHDIAGGGLEFVDVSGLGTAGFEPREIHLTRHNGYSHTVTVDAMRPWIVYNSTSDFGVRPQRRRQHPPRRRPGVDRRHGHPHLPQPDRQVARREARGVSTEDVPHPLRLRVDLADSSPTATSASPRPATTSRRVRVGSTVPASTARWSSTWPG